MGYNGKIKPEFLEKALERFSEYKAQKESLVLRMREDNLWYAQRFAGLTNRKNGR